MKQLNTLVAAIATFCCSTLLHAQTLEDLVNLDALLACECELVLEPVCVDLGVGVTFPAPNACVAECLALPIVEGGDCMTPEALSFWLAYFGVDPSDFGDFEDIEDLLEDLLDDYLEEEYDEWDGDWDGHDDDDHGHHGGGHHGGGHGGHGGHHGGWDGHHHGDSLGVDTLDGDWHHGGDWDGDHDHDGGCEGDTTGTDSVSTGGALIHGWDLQELLDERRNSHGTHWFTNRDMEEFQIKAFPNPATDVVVATLPEWAEEIRLVSMNGKAASIQRISKESLTQFDVSSFAPGTYLVVALGEGLKASTPLIIKR